MNWTSILKYTAGITILLIVLFLGFLAYIAFIPPERYQPETIQIPDQSSYALDKKVGWYHLNDSSKLLITWRPHGGLMTLNFDDFANNNLLPDTKNKFSWYRDGDTLAVTFTDSADVITGFSWIDSSSVEHLAKKLENPPYNQQLMKYNNGNVPLQGTLFRPNIEEVTSAAVIIHGSGTSHRNNFWYLYQSHYLAQRGIMILLPDKRGSGASGGEWHTASMSDFAEDAIAGAKTVQELLINDSVNLGFIGFSQGGAIAPLAGAKYKETDFVVDVVGSAVSYNEQLKFEIYNDVLSSGVPKFLAPVVTVAYTRRAKARRPIWWEKNGSYSSLPYFEKLDIPTLIIYGGKDTNAPVEASLESLKKIQQSPSDDNITIKVYEDSGHGMGDPETGWISKSYLDYLVEWVKDPRNIK